MTKKKINVSIFINAPKEKIWSVLLDDKTYRKWTSVFMEGSYAEGNWQQGSKILFMSVSGENNAETVQINLRPKTKMKNTTIMLNLNDKIVKGRDSMGSIVTKASITKIFVSVSKEKATKINAANLKEIKLPSQQVGVKNKEQKQLDINFKDLLN